MASSEADISEAVEPGYEAVFEEEPDKKYVCPVCLLVMKDAIQTSCGHRFCQSCILKVSNGSEDCKCPVDNTWFNMADELFPDVAIRREILSLKVKCQQLNKGCTWTDELRDLDAHLASCQFRDVSCGYGCSLGRIRRMDLARHMETCDQRPVNCEHCNSSTTAVDLTKHQLLDCRKFPVACSLCSKTGINREDIPYHLSLQTGDCPRIIIPCPYQKYGCNYSGRREIMSNHEKEATHLHLTCMEQNIDILNKNISLLDRNINSLKGEMQEKKIEFENVVRQLKESQMTSYSGKQLWKVEIAAGQNKYRSRSFYTGSPGYKLHISLELNGHTESSQTYASLFVVCEKGQFDDELLFPFSALCQVTLLARHPGKCHEALVTCTAVQRCRSDAEPFSCQRGRLRFISMEKLLNGTYCVDSCLCFDIAVHVHQVGTFRRDCFLGNDVSIDQGVS